MKAGDFKRTVEKILTNANNGLSNEELINKLNNMAYQHNMLIEAEEIASNFKDEVHCRLTPKMANFSHKHLLALLDEKLSNAQT